MKPVTEDIANQVFEILKKECGVREEKRQQFVSRFVSDTQRPDYRFETRLYTDKLGYNGKFVATRYSWFVMYEPEEKTNERFALKQRVNILLELFKKTRGL